MSSTSPAIITQDEDNSMAMAVSSNSVHHPKTNLIVPVPSKKLVQRDLHGNPVPASKLKIKVKSYKKRNGTLVKKHSRRTVDKAPTKHSNPKIFFKKLSKSKDICRDSVNLAHSLYVEELRSSIYCVGKSKSKID